MSQYETLEMDFKVKSFIILNNSYNKTPKETFCLAPSVLQEDWSTECGTANPMVRALRPNQ